MGNIDFKELEERMVAVLAGMSEEELSKKLMFLPSNTNPIMKGSSIGEVVGSIPNTLITDEADAQPKKKPIPYYQTLNKLPKFVRK